jgi:hypothetical protein
VTFVVDRNLTDDTNDLDVSTARPKPLADRIDAGIQPIGEALAHDDVSRPIRRVGCAKETTFQ